MKFRVEVEHLKTKKTQGVLFSIIHPETQERFYEFVHYSERFGREHCEQIIAEINEGLENAQSK